MEDMDIMNKHIDSEDPEDKVADEVFLAITEDLAQKGALAGWEEVYGDRFYKIIYDSEFNFIERFVDPNRREDALKELKRKLYE